ncbi:MBL fold metallo-hydrolase [Rubritalea marina]|uniref:MBL fold metallo-hydrolase n=1 Tax=Rubritalea marina TaxID=361055 RepID=UPI00037855FF|nr:MBL fold metallo-hydrolase [Rubritalea marina]
MPRNNPKPERQNYSGVKPRRGWVKRNIHFFGKVIASEFFKRRKGSTNAPELKSPPTGTARVTWIGHASFLLQFAETSVLVDPNWALWHGFVKRQRQPGLDIKLLPFVDLVLVSHAHFDHMHKKSLKIVDSREGIVVPQSNGALVKKLGFNRVIEMGIWDQLRFGELEVIHTPCHHWGARYIHDTHRDYGGYIVRSGGITIFHCGDSAYFEGFNEIGERHHIDIAILPIGAYNTPSGRDVHMNPEEAVQAFLELGAEFMIPMHYRTFPLGNEPVDEPEQRLMAEAKRLNLEDRIIILDEGVGIELEGLEYRQGTRG